MHEVRTIPTVVAEVTSKLSSKNSTAAIPYEYAKLLRDVVVRTYAWGDFYLHA